MIMTHHNLGVALGLLLELLLLMLLEATGGRGEETAGSDAGSHGDGDGVVDRGFWVVEVAGGSREALKFSYDLNPEAAIGQCWPAGRLWHVTCGLGNAAVTFGRCRVGSWQSGLGSKELVPWMRGAETRTAPAACRYGGPRL